MSNKTYLRETTPREEVQRVSRQLRQLKARRTTGEVELCRELRFPSDIPNPLVPHRAHRKSGQTPLSHSERVTYEQARLQVDE